MLDTPRTDEVIAQFSGRSIDIPDYYTVLDFARQLERELAIAIKALKYCAIEPGYLNAANNAQHVVAMNALAEISANTSSPQEPS